MSDCSHVRRQPAIGASPLSVRSESIRAVRKSDDQLLSVKSGLEIISGAAEKLFIQKPAEKQRVKLSFVVCKG